MRRRANETAAVATLRNLVSAQAQIQATARIDTDGDGTGEYGGFVEMSGAAPGRMSRVLVPPVLSSAFRRLRPEGTAVRSGYCFRVFLPDRRGGPLGEPQAGFDDGSGIESDLAETTWCAYAWPATPEGGQRVFFVNQAGDVLGTDDDRYQGADRGPEADAAFQRRDDITGPPAIGVRGTDGNTWQFVN
jgi:hypothetical protein